jgi:hypothetical protein
LIVIPLAAQLFCLFQPFEEERWMFCPTDFSTVTATAAVNLYNNHQTVKQKCPYKTGPRKISQLKYFWVFWADGTFLTSSVF